MLRRLLIFACLLVGHRGAWVYEPRVGRMRWRCARCLLSLHPPG